MRTVAIAAVVLVGLLVLGAGKVGAARALQHVVADPGAPATPVQTGARIQLASGTDKDTSKVLYTVPSGRRLVIETVTGRFDQSATGEYAQVGISVGSGWPFYVPLQHLETRGSDYDFGWVGTIPVHVYVAGGQQVMMRVFRERLLEGGSTADVAFSGYLASP